MDILFQFLRLLFLYIHFFPVEKELKQQAIYWFYSSLVSALIPNIKQFKIKDFEVQFKEEIFKKIDEQTKELNKNFDAVFEQVKKSEESLSEDYKKTRDEDYARYAEMLQNLPSKERLYNQEFYTRKHLSEVDGTINGLKQKLQEVGIYKGAIDGEFNQELADAISEFQAKFNVMPIDGTCGSITLAKLGEIIELKKHHS